MANKSLLGFEPGIILATDDELEYPSYQRILALATGLYFATRSSRSRKVPI